MEHRMKIGVIGLGDIAQVAYIDNLHNPAKGREVLYLCDKVKARLEWGANAVPSARVCDDYSEMLKHPDINWVFVLTPMLTHDKIVKQALAAGKNVYTEKPLSMKFDTAASLVETSKKKGLYLASAPMILLYPAYEYVRQQMLAGVIGPVTGARAIVAHGGPDTWPTATDLGWLFRKETATFLPPLPDLAIYGFSYFSHVFGPAKRVTAIGALGKKTRTFDKVQAPGFKPYTMTPTIKDSTVVTLEYANGVLASVTANFVAGGWLPDQFEFYGAEGTILMPNRAPYVKIQSKKPPFDKPEGLHDLDLAGHNGGAAFAGVNWGPIVADHLQKAATMGVEPLVGRDFTLHIIEIITKAMTAARTGETQKLTTRFKRDSAWGV
jgi:predicted dehydrogenase